MNRCWCGLVFALIGSTAAHAAAAEPAHRQHGAHVHGEATLNVGVDGQLLLISLEAPGVSLVGFEHPPHGDTEQSLYDKTVATLRTPNQWLDVPDSAACTLDAADVQPNGFGSDASSDSAHSADEGHSKTSKHEHADFDVTYRYSCHVPLAVKAIGVHLFEKFPDLHKVNVNLVLRDRQGSQVLLPGTTEIRLAQ